MAMPESLDAYHEQFKTIVLQHIFTSLDPSEWTRLRSLGNGPRPFGPGLIYASEATPEMLLAKAVCEDGISIEETLTSSKFKASAVEIGQIEGQPVYYVNKEGIYLWGLDPREGYTLNFWVTHPAYPPGW